MCSGNEILLGTEENSFDIGCFRGKGLRPLRVGTNKECNVVVNASD